MFIDVILGFGMGVVPPLVEPPALVARPDPGRVAEQCSCPADKPCTCFGSPAGPNSCGCGLTRATGVPALKVPCICGQSDQCKCEEGKCPGGCPVQPVAAQKPYTGPAWYGAGGYADACRERDRTGKGVVLLFTDPVNCLHCKRLEAGALADSAVKEGLARTINVRVDVSTPAGAALAATFGVTGWPRVLVYRNGKLSGDVSGNVSARELFLAISP